MSRPSDELLTMLGVVVTAGGTESLSATYVRQTGSLTVTLSGGDGNGRWRRTGTATWFASGATESGIPTGGYTVEFLAVAGWTTPASQPATVIQDLVAGVRVRDVGPCATVPKESVPASASGNECVLVPSGYEWPDGIHIQAFKPQWNDGRPTVGSLDMVRELCRRARAAGFRAWMTNNDPRLGGYIERAK